jgi:hypothetical protein
VSQQRISGRLLDARQFPLKLEPKRFAANTLVFNLDRNPIVAQ